MKKFFLAQVKFNELDFILYHYYCRLCSYRSTKDGTMSRHVIDFKDAFGILYCTGALE